MDPKLHVVHIGARPTYEVVEPEDGVSVVIRYAGNHKEQLTLLRCSVPALAEILTQLSESSESRDLKTVRPVLNGRRRSKSLSDRMNG